jgi:hypothetical protein
MNLNPWVGFIVSPCVHVNLILFSRGSPKPRLTADKRSARAAEILRAAGFSKVRVLEDGLTKWTSEGLPLERDPRVEAASRGSIRVWSRVPPRRRLRDEEALCPCGGDLAGSRYGCVRVLDGGMER